jgi:hypothetical protein
MGSGERRDCGAHYTSEDNILKLINPLFMDGLRKEFAGAKVSPTKKALANFHQKLSNLKFLDPACGCGNFLIIAYRELRRLEHEVIREELRMSMDSGKKLLNLGEHIGVKVEQFSGIEILPWPCQLAKTGMWLMDHLMNVEASDEFGPSYVRIPLQEGANIVEGNALAMDWEDVVPKGELSYILGNPPFGGARVMSPEQKEDMQYVFGDTKGFGNLDYVTAWYKKAADYIGGRKSIKAAFVSTNTITQGEQVALLWKPLLERGVYINFGIPTFKWTNEASGRAAVHCVIVGFGFEETESNINPYLIEAPNVFIERRTKPLCNVPELGIGNKPIDDGNYLFTDEEKAEFLGKEPKAKKWFRQWIGADEFINGYCRHFLFLKHCPPEELRKMPECMKRVEAVKKFRSRSKSGGTRKIANTPLRFHVENIPETPYIVVPEISSEHRRYIPIGFMPPDVLASNRVKIGAGASLYHFGILTSSVHMAWTRAVCGRLEMRYCYSVDIVYNNFPWPDVDAKQAAEIERLAEAVLDARAKHPDSSLADLYDPTSMPINLIKAHNALDRAVMKLYGFDKDMSEVGVVAALMERYRELAGA